MFDVYVWRVLILDVSRETAPAWAAIISNKHWADSRDTISAQIQDDSTANKHDRDAPNTCRFFPLLCATKNYLSDRYKMNKFTLLISLRLTSTYIPQRTCIHLFENSCLDYFGPRKGFPTALFVELLRTRFLFGLVMICSCLHTCDPVDRHWPNRAEMSAEVHFVELRPCWLRPSALIEFRFAAQAWKTHCIHPEVFLFLNVWQFRKRNTIVKKASLGPFIP